MTKAQSATEFMLLIAAILIIFIPIFYLLSDFGIQSGSEMINSQIRTVASTLTEQSRETYYLGLYSREIVTINMPDRIKEIKMVNIFRDPPAHNEYYLLVTYQKDDNLVQIPTLSEVPLVGNACVTDLACAGATACVNCTMDPSDFAVGVKNFKLAVTTQAVGPTSRQVVKISTVYI
jgi:hypothetical protein